MAKRLKDLALGTKDLFMLDPRIIQEEAGWNVRIPGPELDAHIRQLADSIKEIGVQEPVTVYLKNEVPLLTNGHCRLMAVKLAISEGADIKAIPARAEERYANEADRVLGMITRNAGKPLAPLEQAEVFKRLVAFGWSEAEIARKSGFSSVHVVNMLRLGAAPAAVREMVRNGEVSARQAVETIRKEGEQAAEVLGDALAKAREAGKSKATGKHVESKQEPAAGKSADRMTLTCAYQIVRDCNAVFMHNMGLREELPPSVKHYSLAEMLAAKALVQMHEKNQPPPKTITCTCDDRLLAAIYVANHYEGHDPKDCEAVVACAGNAVIVVRSHLLQAKGDKE